MQRCDILSYRKDTEINVCRSIMRLALGAPVLVQNDATRPATAVLTATPIHRTAVTGKAW